MPQNILLVQGKASDAAAVREVLSRSDAFRIEWVNTCARGLRRLAVLGKQASADSPGIAAVLADLNLPDIAGIEAFDRLHAEKPDIPILILSSASDEALARIAVRRGAQDYLLKGRLDDHVLPKAIAGMIDRAASTEALFDAKERAEVTLNSIGDAVVSTNVGGEVTYLNAVAERLTGWAHADALGRPLEEVFRIIDANTREALSNPVTRATTMNQIVGLPPSCILIRRDGGEAAIEDSCAPIHSRRGEVTGAVMVFHDVSKSRAQTQKLARLAQYDSLTDLPNRDLLNERINQAIAGAQRRHAPMAVLYLDLDRFKQINDLGSRDGRSPAAGRRAATAGMRACLRHGQPLGR